MKLLATSLLSTLILSWGCAAGGMAYGTMGTPQSFEQLGAFEREITTDSPEAQRYFNQGLTWTYAFNHDEAVRSFRRAAEIDPSCAMAWWGIAYAQGPNYNDTYMTPARSTAAWNAIQKARAALDTESELERDLINALAARYAETPPKDRRDLEQAFADAMKPLRQKYPDDADIGTIYAESLMIQHPWKLYYTDGTPAREDTLEIVGVLEDVLARHPDHPGANHLYIHAVEPSNDKQRGVAAAHRLAELVPASGHLLHMPSHIYAQVGMWDRSIEQNQRALKSDANYLTLAPEQGIQHGYMSHNAHMLAFSAMMTGQEQVARAAAERMWRQFPPAMLRTHAQFVDFTMCARYDVLKRFGRWDEILAEPAPPAYLPITTAIWRAHRAIAFAAKQDFDNAGREQQRFRNRMQSITAGLPGGMYGDVVSLLLVSEYFIAGEIALQKGELETAAGLLEKAVAIEDTLGYGEPPAWLQPARHTLGAVYLLDKRFADAERVYRRDLDKWPRNGWALLGLSQALAGLGRHDEAQTVRTEFKQVWANADEELTTSCKCVKSPA